MAKRLDLNLHDDDADVDEDYGLDDDSSELDDSSDDSDDVSRSSAVGTAASGEDATGEPAALAITQPVVFPAWRDEEEFESFVSPDSVHVVLKLDDDADISRLHSSISYWPAEFILPLDPTEGPWTEQASLSHAQVIVEQAGDDYFNGGVAWKTVKHDDGVTEFGRYERNDVEHVIVLLEFEGHVSMAYCESADADSVYCSIHDFEDFEEVDRLVVDTAF